jgi:hypothetical protein
MHDAQSEPHNVVIAALALAGGYAIFREVRHGLFLGEWELPAGLPVLARLPVILGVPVIHPRRGPGRTVVAAGLLSLLAIAGTVYFMMGHS